MSTHVVVWGSFLVALAGSFGFQVASTVIRNGVGPSIAVAFLWPLLNLGAIEMMIGSHWRPGHGWTAARYGLSGAVAVISFVISFGHIQSVMLAMGETPAAAFAGPFAIDVLMLLAGASLVALRAPKPRARPRKATPRRKPALRVATA
jgi:hypothetical protein